MNYVAYSFVALSRLRNAEHGHPQGQERIAPSTDALKLTGSARVSRVGLIEPWYVRVFERMLDCATALVVKDRFEFELAFSINEKHPTGANFGLPNLRAQLGLGPEAKGTVILAEVFVIPEAGDDDLKDRSGGDVLEA
jgi:hypothetical protein